MVFRWCARVPLSRGAASIRQMTAPLHHRYPRTIDTTLPISSTPRVERLKQRANELTHWPLADTPEVGQSNGPPNVHARSR